MPGKFVWESIAIEHREKTCSRRKSFNFSQGVEEYRLCYGRLGSVDVWRESLIFQFIIQKHRFVRNHYIQWVEQILKSNVNRAYRSGREQRKKTL